MAPESTPPRIPGTRRLVGTAAVGLALVVTALALPSSGTGREGDLRRRDDARRAAALEARPHPHPAGTAPHSHHDPATKNLVSRAGETGAATQDPTTAAEQRASAAYVARERRTADPELTTVPVTAPAAPAPAGPLRDGRRLLHPDRRRHARPSSRPPTSAATCSTPPTRRFVTAGGTAGEPGDDDRLDGAPAAAGAPR